MQSGCGRVGGRGLCAHFLEVRVGKDPWRRHAGFFFWVATARRDRIHLQKHLHDKMIAGNVG